MQGSSLSCKIKRICSRAQGPGATSKYQSNSEVVDSGDRHPVFGHESEPARYSYRRTQIRTLEVQIQKYTERRRIHKDLLNANPRPKQRVSIGQKAHIACKNNRDDCLLFISVFAVATNRMLQNVLLPPWNFARILGSRLSK